jgi:hypothetical protein
VHVNIPPGQNQLVILRRTDRTASYQVTYYSSIIFPEEEYVKAIQGLSINKQ